MLAAHLDEVGLIATHIDEYGYVRFLPVGELSPLTCLGSRVRFLNGITGVIGAERLGDEQESAGFRADVRRPGLCQPGGMPAADRR